MDRLRPTMILSVLGGPKLKIVEIGWFPKAIKNPIKSR